MSGGRGEGIRNAFIGSRRACRVDLRGMTPLVVYDDRCAPCTSFARAVGALARGRLPLVGHHTELGKSLRAGRLGGDSALEVFWVVGDGAAHGGRAALLPLLKAVVSCRSRPHAGALAAPAAVAPGAPPQEDGAAGGEGWRECGPQGCGPGCGGRGATLARAASLFARSRIVTARGGGGLRASPGAGTARSGGAPHPASACNAAPAGAERPLHDRR